MSFRGAAQREPGIHIPEARVHGFRASPVGRSRNDAYCEAVARRQRARYAARDQRGGGSGVEDAAAPLREAWYYAVPGRQLRTGRLFARVMLGEPIVVGRDQSGAVFALRDICPHRGMPLSAGQFDGREIECCYHGWRFASDGRCTAIPSLAEGQQFDLATVSVPRYPACEVQGNIWVYFGEDPGRAPEIPRIEGFAESEAPRIIETMRFAAALDDCVIGLMDPAPGPFVHRCWWWRSRHSVHEKSKAFEPSPWGFT